MPKDSHQWLVSASHRLLRPLVRILLRHGLAHKDFDAISRRVYAEVAREELAEQGRSSSDSRVAIVTGLSRKEIARLRAETDGIYDSIDWGSANRATRVLAGWHRDPDFTDDSGAPRALSLSDEAEGFPALVRRYSGDIPTIAMVDELERVAAVERDQDSVTVRQRAYLPTPGDVEQLRILGTAGADLLATIGHNLQRQASDSRMPRFQRTVFNPRVRRHALPVFQRLAADQAQQLLEILDDWLERHEATSGEPDDETARAGIGIYYFEGPPQNEDSDDVSSR